jgi:hypothetical protein
MKPLAIVAPTLLKGSPSNIFFNLVEAFVRQNIISLLAISGFICLTGCHGGDNGGGIQIVPVTDASESRFVSSKTLDPYGSDDELKIYPPTNPGCSSYNDVGTKILEPRLVNGFHRTEVQKLSGYGQEGASTTIQTSTISNRTEKTYVEKTVIFSQEFSRSLAISQLCTFSTENSSLVCEPNDDATKTLVAQGTSSGSSSKRCEFTVSTGTESNTEPDKREFGQYNLLNKTSIPAFRRTEIRSGKLTCNGQTVPATEKWVQVTSYDIPSRSQSCGDAIVYDNTFYTDANGKHIKSYSSEITDFSK